MCRHTGLIVVVVSVVVVGVFGVPVEETTMLKRLRRDNFDKNLLTPNNECQCVCGMSNRQMRVVGGNVTKAHEFPWIAGLSKDGEFYCGATVITRRHLLTAAHCVNGIDARKITATLGDHDRKDKSRFSKIQVRRVKAVHAHKLFDPSSYNNDIAVLELNIPLDFDSRVQAACLPNSALTDYSGQLAVVAGWGKTGENEETSTILRKVAVPVWSKKDCYNSEYGEQRLSENMFCAGFVEGKKDACQGDSGGPLQIKNQGGYMDVIGIVSWGRGCARPKLPGIYTKIANYLDWVQDSLNGECLCPPPSHNPRRA